MFVRKKWPSVFGAALEGVDRFAVVDVETTGVYRTDRVVEVAVVSVDASGEVIDEWDTLVDPGRDVGPTWLHGVSASMVASAPTFTEIAAALAARLDGAVVVAHNLPFDERMIRDEFARIDVAGGFGAGVDTLALTGCRLSEACARHNLTHGEAHRALGDARAAAALLRLTGCRWSTPTAPVQLQLDGQLSCRTLRREASGATTVASLPPGPFLAVLAGRVRFEGVDIDELRYVELLDWALADLRLDADEQAMLVQLATDLGLSAKRTAAVHHRYFDGLLSAAIRDHLVTDDEYGQLLRSATALGIPTKHLAEAVADYRPGPGAGVVWRFGMRVCFTGAATDPDTGHEVVRSELEQRAEKLGWVPVNSVTKRGCDVLAAADPASQSGKADKARLYGIPIVGVADLLAAAPGDQIPALITTTNRPRLNPMDRDDDNKGKEYRFH